jgi:hypothetical protein
MAGGYALQHLHNAKYVANIDLTVELAEPFPFLRDEMDVRAA